MVGLVGNGADSVVGGRVDVGETTGVLVGDSSGTFAQEIKRRNKRSVIFLIMLFS